MSESNMAFSCHLKQAKKLGQWRDGDDSSVTVESNIITMKNEAKAKHQKWNITFRALSNVISAKYGIIHFTLYLTTLDLTKPEN